MRGRRRHRKAWVGLSVLAIETVLVLLGGQRPAAATGSITYYVSVYANEPYGLSPDFQTQVIAPALPPGASLDGGVSCTEVYDNGTDGPAESVYGRSGLGLDPGTYYLVAQTCSGDLSLSGTSGDIQLVGGPYTVAPDPTELDAIVAEKDVNTDHPTVTFAGEVIAVPLDDSAISGQTVRFGYQQSNGVWFRGACSAVTTADGDGNAPATCTLAGQDATNLIAGTGAWEAEYGATTDYLGSSASGTAPGQTTSAQAAANLQQLIDTSGITVTPTTYPPGCHPAPDETDVSLIGISLGQLDCSQLQVLTTIDGIALGFAFGGGEAGVAAVADVADTVAWNAAVDSVNAERAAFLSRLAVIGTG